MKKIIATITNCIFFTALAFGQTTIESGSQAVINYTPKEYGAEGQNWAIVQDAKGILYVGNNGGLMEFDGVEWKIYRLPNESVVRSLAIGDSGKIYAGAQGDLGYFQPDAMGRLVFHSLLSHIPEAKREVADVFQTYFVNGKVYFNAFNYLFTWDIKKQEFSIIPSTNKFHLMFLVDGKLYIREWEKGLEVMQNESLSLVKGGKQFANEPIYVMLPFPGEPGTTLVVTRSMGLFKYDGQQFIPFKTEADGFVKENLIFSGAILTGNTILLGTTNGGAVVIDNGGKLLQRYNMETGINSNTILFTFSDRSGAAWLATAYGISRIDISSPVSYFDKRNNYNSYATDIIRYQGTLYVATGTGVSFFNPQTNSFQPLKNSKTESWDFLNTGKDLLVATKDGLFKVEKNELIPVRKTVSNEYVAFVLERSASDTDRVYIATFSGLWSVRKSGNGWIDEGQIAVVDYQKISIVEDEDGGIWLGTLSSGLHRIKFRKNDAGNILLKDPLMEHFNLEKGLQSGYANAIKINKVNYFIADSIYRFNETRKHFYADTSDKLIAAVYKIIQQNPIRTFLQDMNGNIWLQTKGKLYMGSFQPDGSLTWVSEPFNQFADESVYSAYTEKNGNTWLGAGSMIVRYDFNSKKSINTSFAALLRQVTIGKDSTIYFGHKTEGQAIPEIFYANNSFRFRYAATSYEGKNTNQFKIMLEGFDKDWSAWSHETTKEYTNLPPGKYTFNVKALNILGIESTVDSYSFEILPPWWRTWWAYVLYAMAAIGLIWLIVVYRSRQLKTQNLVLEKKVEVRTAQLNQSLNDLKMTQAQLVQSEKMASLGELTAGIAHEIQNPLNFVNNFSEVNREMIVEMKEEITKGNYAEVKVIANDIKENEQKINHHGKRADAIVKGMLQHSRNSSGQKEPTDINALADEYLRLSYHGLRAKDKDFNANFTTDFDESIGNIEVVPQDIGRVLLNLYNNAFYSANEKKKQLNGAFEPTVSVSTKRSGGNVEIIVKDNGNGIPQKIADKIFQPFFTTKPTGQGTGLGLSLSYDIIKAHGGELKVETKEGEGAEFIIILSI